MNLLLNRLPSSQRDDALDAINAFIPIRDLEGPEGLREVERAIRNTARWFP